MSFPLQVTGKWYFGSIFCKVWAAVDVLCCTASILSLCVISVDRYIGITRPLSYYSIVTSKRYSVLCVTIWISSIAISIGPLLGWRESDVNADNSNSLICTVLCHSTFNFLILIIIKKSSALYVLKSVFKRHVLSSDVYCVHYLSHFIIEFNAVLMKSARAIFNLLENGNIRLIMVNLSTLI